MTTRSGRNRRLLDGRIVGPDHEPHLTWEDLVLPATKQPRTPRTGEFYARMEQLPTPTELRTFDPVPDNFEGMSRWQWRAMAGQLARNLRTRKIGAAR